MSKKHDSTIKLYPML